jgi:hypothetical protein
MTTSHTASATIYEFPVGGRSGRVKGIRSWEKPAQPQAAVPVIMPESGWYHDVATKNDPSPKN